MVKSELGEEVIRQRIRKQAQKVYSVNRVVERYMDCVEEIINIPVLLERFKSLANENRVSRVIDEVVLQSRVEFNYDQA